MSKFLIFLFFILIVLVSPRHTSAVNLLIGQGCASGNGGAGASIACTVNNTAGLGQIIAVKWCDTDNTCTVSTSSDTLSCTDTQLNSYMLDQRIDSASGTDRRAMAVLHAQNIGANAANIVTCTVTSSNSVNLLGEMVSAIAGVTSTMTADVKGTLDVVAASSPVTVTTSGATTSANELVYAWINVPTGTTLTIGTGYSTNRQVDVNEKDEWTTVSTTGTKSATMTYTGSVQQRGIIVTYKTVALVAGTYYLANASTSPAGLDTNSGTDAAHPWLTPSHPMTCGSTIIAAASTAYSEPNFYQSNWGAVDCPGANDVVWLKCVTFDACKITSGGGGNPGIYIDSNFWGVQGWEVTVTSNSFAGCFYFVPNNGTHVSVHHGIFANNICNGAYDGGFACGISGSGSADYCAIIGNIAYDASKSAAGNNCYSNINIYQPLDLDQKPGTHIYIAGNYSFAGVNTPACASGSNPATDGEGINIDSLDGSQGSPAPYTQQVVVDNNIVVGNGGRGIETEFNSVCTSCAHIYIRHNTSYGNSTDMTQNAVFCPEMGIFTGNNIEYFSNLSMATVSTGCMGNAVYAYQVHLTSTTTDHIYNNWAYSAAGNNLGITSSSGFSFGPNNITGTNPNFANPVVPGAPSCGSSTSVPNCMATVIANFTPTTAAAIPYGYQPVSTTSIYDPLYPQWLCTVTNLPTGLVTPGCLTGSSTGPGTIMNSGTKMQ